MTQREPQRERNRVFVLLVALFGLAGFIVIGMVALMAATKKPDKGARFHAYADECPMDVTFTIGTSAPVTQKNALGPMKRSYRGAWVSGDYELPSGTKLALRATAPPCRTLNARHPFCDITYKSEKLMSVPSRGDATCSAEAVVP